jgi:large subunit ribosomal protein L25
MAKQAKLTATPRSETGRSAVGRLRRGGSIPAVVYGSATEPENLQVSGRELEVLLAGASSEHLLVELVSASGPGRLAMIQEIQHEPLTGKILHVDFHAVRADEEMEAVVPVEPVGEPAGVKTGGGLLEQLVRELPIRCLPAHLPERIRVDVSALDIGDAIHVSSIALPEGVAAAADGDLTVFLVAAPTVAVAEEAEAGPSEPEVIKEKKEEGAEQKS